MEDILNTAPLTVEKSPLKKGDLEGEVAVITGAGSNIGLAVARTLAWLGASVVIAEYNAQTGAAAADLINKETKPGTALFVETDVTKESSINNMAKKAIESFGKVDILDNNAMNMQLGASVLNCTPEVLDAQYAMTARATLMGIRAFVPAMIQRHHGVVMYMASQPRFGPAPANYCATKSAATSLVLSLAAELGSYEKIGVAAYVFVPGLVGRPRPRPPSQAQQAAAPRFEGVNPGYDGSMPPEDCAAAIAYCMVHAGEIHGSGVTAGQVQKHMGWPFPRPDLVPKPDFERLREGVEIRLWGYVGQGFAKPGDPTVSISRSDAIPGESLTFHSLMGVAPKK